MKHMRGFTLIELMMVVAIIAILASLAVTIYQNSIGKAQLSEAFTIIDGMKTDVVEYYNQSGACPTTGSNELRAATSYSGRYVEQVDVAPVATGCSVTATMRAASIAPKLLGKTVTFTMSSSNGASSWQCASNADAVYLPATCR